MAVETVTQESSTRNRRKILRLYTCLIAVAFLGFICWAIAILFGVDQSGFSSAMYGLALALTISLAASAVGGFLGFLYGVPRRTQIAASGADNAGESVAGKTAAASQQPQTYLDQIAGWLTSVLLGAGLTQAKPIAVELANAINYACTRSGVQTLPFCEPVVGSGMIATGVLGFVFGFYFSKTIMAPDINAAEQAEANLLKSVQILNAAEVGAPGANPPTGQVSEEVRQAAQQISQAKVTDLKTVAELMAWAKARILSGDIGTAVTALQKAASIEPNDTGLRRFLALMRIQAGEATRGLNELSYIVQSTNDINAKLDRVWGHLYENPPTGFANAISEGTELLAQVPDADAPRLRAYLACAYGQAFNFESESSAPNPGLLAHYREMALENLRFVRDRASPWLETLRATWDTAAGSSDDDLLAFKNDPDFIEAFAKKAAAA